MGSRPNFWEITSPCSVILILPSIDPRRQGEQPAVDR